MTKRILFLHPKLLFYKTRIYNALNVELEKRGYLLYLWATDIQDTDEPINFNRIKYPMTIANFIKVTRDLKIDIIINMLSKTPSLILFYYFTLFYSKLFGKKTVYYGHGLDLSRRYNKPKVLLQNLTHLLFDRILLYSSNERKYLWPVNQRKSFIANNTLLLKGYETMAQTPKEEIKSKYRIKQKKIVLFSGRIERRKRLDVLLNIFIQHLNNSPDVCLIIVGPNITADQEKVIESVQNIYYLGPIYDEITMGELFYVSDLFCIPGHIGLGLVEAMYWKTPVLTMNVLHAPEVVYLRNGYNGYLLDSENDLADKLIELINNDDLLSQLSGNARKAILVEASLDKMFSGFNGVLDSLHK